MTVASMLTIVERKKLIAEGWIRNAANQHRDISFQVRTIDSLIGAIQGFYQLAEMNGEYDAMHKIHDIMSQLMRKHGQVRREYTGG